MEPPTKAYYTPTPSPSRRRFLKLAAGIGGVAALGILSARLWLDSQREGNPEVPGKVDYLDSFNSNIVSGGPGKDGIPSIDGPKFLSREEADGFLEPHNVVFGLYLGGEARAYPQRILVWHEIVNDVIDQRAVSVTYCPLTGSQLAFDVGPAGDAPRTFGTTGKLVNSNLLMYDRGTDSNWPQILSIAINGPSRGESLSPLPLVWTTWDKWRERFPETKVLSYETGFLRNYSLDYYGTYSPEPGGYYADSQTWFPLMNSSDLMGKKEVVLGIRKGPHRLAVPFRRIQSVGVDNISLGGEPIVLLYDSQLDTARAYSRVLEGETLSFSQTEGGFMDLETGSTWSPDGESTEGPLAGHQLTPMEAFNVMWFAWYAFFPETQVYG